MNTPLNNSVKKLTLMGAVLLLAVACNQAPQGELDNLIAQRDSLRTVREQAEQALLKVEMRIAELDSSAEVKLITQYSPERATFRHYFDVYGNVETDRAATLYPESPGLVRQILVQEGEVVRTGQILVRLDSELLASNMAELRNSLDLATTLYDKQARLWDQNIGSEVQFLEAKNRKESLEKSMKTMQEQINKSSIRAPFDGLVDKIFPKQGELASGQTPVVRIVNTKNLYITADVSERYVGNVQPGDEVFVVINRTDTITASISRVGSYINPNNRSFQVRVNLEESYDNLMPNSLVVLKINDFTIDDAIAIPSSLIMQDGNGKDYVYVAEVNGNNRLTARKRPINTGVRYLGRTLVTDGIDGDQAIIDKGSRSVRDGDHIKVADL